MARIISESGPYRVETAVRVWRQLDELPLETVRAIQRRMEDLSRDIGGGPKPSKEDAPTPLSLYFVIDGYAVVVDVSHGRRTITLLDIARQMPGGERINRDKAEG